MLKYTLGAICGVIAVLVAVFAVLAWSNGDDEPGMAPDLTVRVSESAVEPARLEVDEDQFVHLKLVNDAQTLRVMSSDRSVQQLPPGLDDYDPRAPSDLLPYLRIQAPSGGETSAFVRFTARGSYELRIETPGRSDTWQVLTIVVV